MDTIERTLRSFAGQTGERTEGPGTQRLYIAIISSSDRVLLTLIARGRYALETRLAAYVEQNATEKLWPEDAARALELIENHQAPEAIDYYFDHVGVRWDREGLHREVVELD